MIKVLGCEQADDNETQGILTAKTNLKADDLSFAERSSSD